MAAIISDFHFSFIVNAQVLLHAVNTDTARAQTGHFH